jgi:hypothetical protein
MLMNGLSCAPGVKQWLTTTRHPRILHIFDRACNLINERGEVLSIVTREIGDGPFNMVVAENISFFSDLHTESRISIADSRLTLGRLIIYTGNAQLWNPCPDWNRLHTHRDKIVQQIAQLRFTNNQFSDSLPSAVAIADLPSCLTATRQLAGLGIGLTPSGDDFIMGAMYAAWIIHPPEAASVLAREIGNTAAPLTTSLSAAWLKAAGKGEAGILWHDFFGALVSANTLRVRETLKNILAVGETSGADTLAGFTRVFNSLMKKSDAS